MMEQTINSERIKNKELTPHQDHLAHSYMKQMNIGYVNRKIDLKDVPELDSSLLIKYRNMVKHDMAGVVSIFDTFTNGWGLAKEKAIGIVDYGKDKNSSLEEKRRYLERGNHACLMLALGKNASEVVDFLSDTADLRMEFLNGIENIGENLYMLDKFREAVGNNKEALESIKELEKVVRSGKLEVGDWRFDDYKTVMDIFAKKCKAVYYGQESYRKINKGPSIDSVNNAKVNPVEKTVKKAKRREELGLKEVPRMEKAMYDEYLDGAYKDVPEIENFDRSVLSALRKGAIEISSKNGITLRFTEAFSDYKFLIEKAEKMGHVDERAVAKEIFSSVERVSLNFFYVNNKEILSRDYFGKAAESVKKNPGFTIGRPLGGVFLDSTRQWFEENKHRNAFFNMSKKYHPDAGGSDKVFQKKSNAFNELKKSNLFVK